MCWKRIDFISKLIKDLQPFLIMDAISFPITHDDQVSLRGVHQLPKDQAFSLGLYWLPLNEEAFLRIPDLIVEYCVEE